MSFCATPLLLFAVLAGCQSPPVSGAIAASSINQSVIGIADWDMGCDNQGQCMAIGALPPRLAKMNGIRGALRIVFRGDADPELTIIPLDFEQRLPDVKLNPLVAADLLENLRSGDVYMLWHRDGDGSRYYLPGKNFATLEALYRSWQKAFPITLVQQEPIVPAKAVELGGFVAPTLTDAQLAQCDAPDKGIVEAAWQTGGQFYIFRYRCSTGTGLRPQSLWFTQQVGRRSFDAIGLPEAVGPKTDGKAAGLFNAYFEPTQGVLVTRRSSGSPDCGRLAVYAATPSGFVPALRHEARRCAGLFPGDWVRTFRNPAVMLPEAW
jgi:hypothetical protein